MNQREQSLADTRSRIMQHAKRQIWVTFQKEGIHAIQQQQLIPH